MDITMTQLKNWNPSNWDSRSNYMGTKEFDEYYVVYCKTRDSNSILCDSNWEILCKELHAEENNGVEIVRFGHWACGHYDLLLVSPDSKMLNKAQEFCDSLESYPILNEDHYSNLMAEKEADTFADCYESDFRSYIESFGMDTIIESDSELIDASDVSFEELWTYFDTCMRDANCNWEDSDNGLYCHFDLIAEKITIQGILRSLSNIRVDKRLLDTLPHWLYHEMITHGIGVMTLDNELYQVPDFISVQHNKNQLKLDLK